MYSVTSSGKQLLPHLYNRVSLATPFVTSVQPTAMIKSKEISSYKAELFFFPKEYTAYVNDRFADAGNADKFLGLENVPSRGVGGNLNQTSAEAPNHI